MTIHNMNVWEGVFDCWDDAPRIDGAFDSNQWLGASIVKARDSLKAMQVDEHEISDNARCYDYILPVVCAMAQKKGEVLKILDFGGGLASDFFKVFSMLHSPNTFEFHVVEGTVVCNTGAELFSKNMNIFFHDKIPEKIDFFGIIHAGSSLQYINDWRGLLASFSALQPRYLILSDIAAGNIDPFVTIQNYYGYKIRVRFLNIKELVDKVESLGFKLLYQSLYVAKILGKEVPLPMDNLPKSRRLKHSCQLLFELI